MQVQQNVTDPLFERKVDLVTEGLPAGYAKRLKLVSQVSQGNALTICNYIMAMKTEINSSDDYRRTNVAVLTKLSKFFRNQKSFNQIRREDVAMVQHRNINQRKMPTPYRYPCVLPKCRKDAIISAVKVNKDGSLMMRAEYTDKSIEDHTWNEYAFFRVNTEGLS
jgi:hypothetical protein